MKKLFFLLFLLPIACFSQEYKGSILSIIDGDTFVFQTEEGNIKVRLFGIDAPEKKQTYGLESKAYLETYRYKQGKLKRTGTDKYGRTLGILFIDNKNINLDLIKNGYAWHYKRYSDDIAFAQAEKEARQKKIGLWKHPDPMAPWNFRKSNR